MLRINRHRIRGFLLFSLWLQSFIAVALAQSFTATVTGKVTDGAGAVAPGAGITLTNTGANRVYSAITAKIL